VDDDKVTGTTVLAIGHRELQRSVEKLVASVGVETLSHLKVRSGEHIAAILTTAFLDVPPTAVDVDGLPLARRVARPPPYRPRTVTDEWTEHLQ
jgi:hypothetical protein